MRGCGPAAGYARLDPAFRGPPGQPVQLLSESLMRVRMQAVGRACGTELFLQSGVRGGDLARLPLQERRGQCPASGLAALVGGLGLGQPVVPVLDEHLDPGVRDDVLGGGQHLLTRGRVCRRGRPADEAVPAFSAGRGVHG